MNIHLLKIKAKALSPLVRIGKAGVNESVISEIKKQLYLHELVKVKLLKSSIADTNITNTSISDSENNTVWSNEKKELVNDILTKTNSQLILLQGNMVTIYKKKN